MSKKLMITSFIPTKEKISLKAKDLLKEQAFTITLMKKLDLSGIDGFLKR